MLNKEFSTEKYRNNYLLFTAQEVCLCFGEPPRPEGHAFN